MKKGRQSVRKAILIIGTLDTKEDEILFCRDRIKERGYDVLLMDAGILRDPKVTSDIPRSQVAKAGGAEDLKALVAKGDKGQCVETMIDGAAIEAARLYKVGAFQGILGVGGAQGTAICSSAMRALPTGVPKLIVSTVASGRGTFGPYVGTKDITMMHSVADIQGLNFLTKRILTNATAAICGMVEAFEEEAQQPRQRTVALSMLGTTTRGALRAKEILEDHGFEVVAFHQNGTGGIAMEDLIREKAFQGVMDLNLHEIGDRWYGGLHGAIRPDRLEAAGTIGIPQVVAPGSINYVVLGPLEELPAEIRARKLIVHNPTLTLVRLTPEELREVGRVTAEKLNLSIGPTRVFIPLRGFCDPDREGFPLWDPKGNQAFIESLEEAIRPDIGVVKLDAHINEPDFIDPVVREFITIIEKTVEGYGNGGGKNEEAP
jgi:uncharacterized protein (UPF0261 family)